MGVLGVEKSKKRKRSLNQSALESEAQKENDELQKEAPTPEQKPAKKRKKSKQDDSIVEDTSPVVEKKTKAKKAENDSETPSKKKKSKVDTSEEVEQDENDSQPSKKKKTNKVNKAKEVEQDKKDSLSPKKTKTKKNEKKKSTKEEKEPEISEVEKKKKKKKDKTAKTPFGVVDSKLLAKSGGDSNTDESKTGPKPKINRAVDYLRLWKSDKKSWKFNKGLQTMLLKSIYNPVIIDEDDFEMMLLYFQDCKGGARDKLKTDAMALIKEDDHIAEPVDPDMEKRAREILQMLG